MDPDEPKSDPELAAGLAEWLSDRRGLRHVTVSGLHRPSAGYSSETLIVDVTWSSDDLPHHGSLVIRMAPTGAGTFPAYDLVPQWQAQDAVAEEAKRSGQFCVTNRWLGGTLTNSGTPRRLIFANTLASKPLRRF